MKTLRTAMLTCVVALMAAGCNPFEHTREEGPAWHYWIAPILAVSIIGVCMLLFAIYMFKIVIPKYRGTKS